jgi:hypothetical protein
MKYGWEKSIKSLRPLLLVLISSCSDSPSDSQNTDAIQVKIDNQISQQIQIMSTSGTNAGKVNPVEVQIIIKNISASPQQVLLDGRWLDSKGRFNGGSQRVLMMKAGQSQTIQEGTRSSRVKRYEARLTATKKSQDQLLSETLASNKLPIAKGYGMTYSTTPTSEEIPSWPVRGVANGLPFDAKILIFRTNEKGQWKLAISDRTFDPLKSNIAIVRSDHPDVQTVYINLPDEPAKGKVFQQKMQYGGGMFQIKPTADSQSTTSWNTSLAYEIEITDWQKEPSTNFSCGRPKTGKASGKLYISFKGSESQIKNSWISGSFKDATILYCNDN